LITKSYVSTIKELRMPKKYILYSVLYGITTLIVPLSVQFLVNNLALSGIWINIFGFIIIIGTGLTISLLLRYSQIVLNENLQRELFLSEISKWKSEIEEKNRTLFMEIFFAIKSFSKSFTSLIEIFLVTFFGIIVMMAFHPAFLILAIITGATLYQIRESTKPAIESSIEESNQKYELFRLANTGTNIGETEINNYLANRHEKFRFISSNTIKIFILFVVGQLLLLGGGSWLIQINQLSIGQLVSAEIIFSGITVSLNKLPTALESLYEFETNIYKLVKAKGEYHE
jgi:putative ABC transport system ATP-binding protein